MSDGALVDAKTLAKRLGVPASWVYDRTRPGQSNPLPHYRIGRYVRFDLDEILVLLRRETGGGVVSSTDADLERRALGQVRGTR